MDIQKKITDKNKVFGLTMLFMILYTVSYLTRVNYGAVISEIVKTEGIPKSDAALALTASAVTYGLGQIISGYLGDKLNPKKLILFGMTVTILMNLIIPFLSSPYAMSVVWGINGVAQAFMWPPLIRIMITVFETEDYKRACLVVSCAASLGTMIVYAISPICILIGGWRLIFIFSAILAVIMAVVWTKKCPNVGKIKLSAESANSQQHIDFDLCIILGATMLATALQGTLRDGVSTWMPSYVAETFHLDNKIAILTGVVLPLISIITTQITGFIYRKIVKTELLLAAIMFGGGFVSSYVLFAADGVSAGLSVAMAAVLSGCMHGASWVMTSMIPPHFEKYGKISFVCGLLNCSTYIGSAVSAYGIARYSENCGWRQTLLLWSFIALLGGIICFVCGIFWKRSHNVNEF